jgi:hypothetical protein
MTVVAIELNMDTGKATGYMAEHLAHDFNDGVQAVLYTAKLKDGRACLGSTGRVVYPHGVKGGIAIVVKRGEL